MEIIDALSILDAKADGSNDCNFKMACATIHKELAEALKPSHNSHRDEIIRLLDCMSSDERMEVFGEYCKHCGDKNPHCQCWNDE